MQHQLARASDDARVRLAHDGVELGVHRGHIVVHAPAVAPFALRWRGEMKLALPHGTLEFTPTPGTGLAATVLAQGRSSFGREQAASAFASAAIGRARR